MAMGEKINRFLPERGTFFLRSPRQKSIANPRSGFLKLRLCALPRAKKG